MSASAGPDIIEDGLVLCLDAGNRKSYPGSGTIWADLAGSNNGTLTNGPTFSSANRGSIVFDGSNDYVSAPVSESFEFGTGDFTVEVWARLTTISSLVPILNLGQGAAGPNVLYTGWSLHYRPGALWFYRFDGTETFYTFSTTLVANTIYYILICRTGTSLRCFVNGVQVGSTATTSLSYNKANNDPLQLGFWRTGGGGAIYNYFTGHIYSSRIYKGKGLTPAEILQNYNATKGRFKLI